MPALLKKLRSSTSQPLFFGLIILFFLLIFATIFLALRLSKSYSQKRQEFQEEQYKSPATAIKRQVQKISLTDEAGETVEMSLNGQVNSYDASGSARKRGLQGFALTDALLNRLNDFLENDKDTFVFKGSGRYTLVVETNQGNRTITLIGDENADQSDEGADDLLDIIEDIEDATDNTLNPTPTPTPAPTIPPGSSPTPIPHPEGSPTPYPTPFPSSSPTPTPGGEASLPDYMLKDPFTCEDYTLNKAMPISNIVCGLEEE